MVLRRESVRSIVFPPDFRTVGQAQPGQVAVAVVFVCGGGHLPAAALLVGTLSDLGQAACRIIGIGKDLFRGIVDLSLFVDPAVGAVIAVFHCRPGTVADTDAAVVSVVFVGNGMDSPGFALPGLVVPVADFPDHVSCGVVAVLGELVQHGFVFLCSDGFADFHKPAQRVIAVQFPGAFFIRLPLQIAFGGDQLDDIPMQIVDVALLHGSLRIRDLDQAVYLVVDIAPALPGICLLIIGQGRDFLDDITRPVIADPLHAAVRVADSGAVVEYVVFIVFYGIMLQLSLGLKI